MLNPRLRREPEEHASTDSCRRVSGTRPHHKRSVCTVVTIGTPNFVGPALTRDTELTGTSYNPPHVWGIFYTTREIPAETDACKQVPANAGRKDAIALSDGLP